MIGILSDSQRMQARANIINRTITHERVFQLYQFIERTLRFDMIYKY